MTGFDLMYHILQFVMHLDNLKTYKIAIQKKKIVGKRKVKTYKIAIQKIFRKK